MKNKKIINEYMKRPAKKQIVFAISKKRKISPSSARIFHFSIYPSTDIKNNKRTSIKYMYADESVSTASTKVEKQKKKSFSWSSLLFLLLNIVIIAIIFIVQNNSEEGVLSLRELFSGETFSVKYLFILLAVFVVDILLETIKYYILILKTTKRKRKALSYKVMALGRYYDCISPLSAAGEPYQIYYLNKRGVRGEKATSIPIFRLISWQFVYSVLSIILVIINYTTISNINVAIVTAAWIGIICNSSLFAIIILLSVSKKIGPKLVIWVLKILFRLKIVKNYQHSFRKVMRFVNSYQMTIKNFASSFSVLISEFFVTLLETIASSSFVYLIFLMLNNGATFSVKELIDSISLVVIVNQASTFMPMPGGAGVMEFVFTIVFGAVFSGAGTLFWALLIWRFLTYYFFIIQGLFVLLYDFLIGNKKAEKLNELGYWNENKKINNIFFKTKSNKVTRERILVNYNNIANDSKSRTVLCTGIIKSGEAVVAIKTKNKKALDTIKKFDTTVKPELEQKKRASIERIRAAQENIKNERKIVAELKKEERKIKSIEREEEYRKRLEKKIELERREQLKKELQKKSIDN